MDCRLENVEALWPRIDRPYARNEATGSWDAVDATDPRGAYEMSALISEEQAKDLAGKMREVFNTHEKTKGKQWVISKKDPETGLEADRVVKSLDDIFVKDDGVYRAKFKMPTYSDPTTKPRQFMHDGTKAADDFQLTMNSIIHVTFRIAAWTYGKKCGISLRPTGVMVVRLAERKEPEKEKEMFADLVVNDSGFGDLVAPGSGGTAPATQEAAPALDPFGLPDDKKEESQTTAGSNDLDDEIPF